jgi:hypothetical protein
MSGAEFSKHGNPQIWQEFSWPSFILFYAILIAFFFLISILNMDGTSGPIAGLGARAKIHLLHNN